MSPDVRELLNRVRAGSIDAEHDLAQMIPEWKWCSEAPIPPADKVESYFRFNAIIQDSTGTVIPGYAKWTNVGRMANRSMTLRWYAYHCDRWIPEPVLFMPMPSPKVMP